MIIIGLMISAIGGAGITYLIMVSRKEMEEEQKRLKHQEEEFCQCYEKITLEQCPDDILRGFQSYEEFESKLTEIKRGVKQYNL